MNAAASVGRATGAAGLGAVVALVACGGGDDGSRIPATDTATRAAADDLVAGLDAAFNARRAGDYWTLYEPLARRRGAWPSKLADMLKVDHGTTQTSAVREFRTAPGGFGIAWLDVKWLRSSGTIERADHLLAFRAGDPPKVHVHVRDDRGLADHVKDDGAFVCKACNYRFGAKLDRWVLALAPRCTTDCVGNVHYYALGADLEVKLSVGFLPDEMGLTRAAETVLRAAGVSGEPVAQPWSPEGLRARDAQSASYDLARDGEIDRVDLVVRPRMFYLLHARGEAGLAPRWHQDVAKLRASLAFVDAAKSSDAITARAGNAYSKGELSGKRYTHAGLDVTFTGPTEWTAELQTGSRPFAVEYSCPDHSGVFSLVGFRCEPDRADAEWARLEDEFAEQGLAELDAAPEGLEDVSPPEPCTEWWAMRDGEPSKMERVVDRRVVRHVAYVRQRDDGVFVVVEGHFRRLAPAGQLFRDMLATIRRP